MIVGCWWCILFTATAFASAFAAADSGIPPESACSPVVATRGEPLLLSCRGVQGCHVSRPRWTDRTGEIHQEIRSGVDPQTGVLTVTSSATGAVGGQEYECSCAAGSSNCYTIHIPPEVSIAVSTDDVEVGGEVDVTCSAHDGYPVPPTLSLVLRSRGVVTVGNGEVHTLRGLTTEDAGLLSCELNDVSTQPIAQRNINIFYRPEVVKVENANIILDGGRGGSTAVSCTVRHNQCHTAVMFTRDGSPIGERKRLSQFNEVIDEGLSRHVLVISGVQPSDLGVYHCEVYANLSRLFLVESRELFVLTPETSTAEKVLPLAPPSCSVNVYMAVGLGVTILLLMSVLLLVILILARLHCKHKKGPTETDREH